MSEDNHLHQALLDLGLEDLIPLPEAAEDPEVLDTIGMTEPVQGISLALLELLRQGEIEVWRGPWDGEPVAVGAAAAESLLRDVGRYSLLGETNGADRVFYVNVRNTQKSLQ